MKEQEHNKQERWIVKVGSSLVTSDGTHLDLKIIQSWANQIAELKSRGKQVALVTSGSIADGMNKLGWENRPQHVHQLQAAAAVGQMGLIKAYHDAFVKHDIRTAQILLTHEDFANHQRYLNARETLNTLLHLGVVPIINENDTVSTQEIQLGDNDTLSAYVANVVGADILLIMTDQRGLFDRDPSIHKDANLIKRIAHNDPKIDQIAGPSSNALGRGGMITKVAAARRAALSATPTVIASGKEKNLISRIADGEDIGTFIETDKESQSLRKLWIMGLKPSGTLVIDKGAANALKTNHKSLLPIGVITAEGIFGKGDMLICKTPADEVIAYGLTNYTSEETTQILGKGSTDVKALIGESCEPELIHKDNLIIL